MPVVGLLVVGWAIWFIYRLIKGVINTTKEEWKEIGKDSVNEIKKNITNDSARGVGGRNIGKFF